MTLKSLIRHRRSKITQGRASHKGTESLRYINRGGRQDNCRYPLFFILVRFGASYKQRTGGRRSGFENAGRQDFSRARLQVSVPMEWIIRTCRKGGCVLEASESKKTPLYEAHLKAGGKIVDFHGWLLPVQYGGIIEEHERVRSAAGLFDVSHMGEIFVRGEDAGEYIQNIITNDISGMADGQVIYSPMCLPDGGTVDDLIAYRFDERNYMLVVNASNLQKDFEWVMENRKGRVEIKNLSDEYASDALPITYMPLGRFQGAIRDDLISPFPQLLQKVFLLY